MSKTKRHRPDSGSLAILNTGAGDIVVTFNDHTPAETEQAIAMLLDMQKRGYAILVRQDDGTYARAVSINKETQSYVVVPPAPTAVERVPDTVAPRRRGKRVRVEQPVKGRKAVAVARSAGGCAPRSPLAMLASARAVNHN